VSGYSRKSNVPNRSDCNVNACRDKLQFIVIGVKYDWAKRREDPSGKIESS